MSARNTPSNSTTCDCLSQSSSPNSQENQTLVQEIQQVNDFDHQEMKMETGENEETLVEENTIRKISSPKLELQEVDDADHELLWWKINVNEETPVERNTIRRSPDENNRIKEFPCRKTLEQQDAIGAYWKKKKKMSEGESDEVVETAYEETQTKEQVLEEDDYIADWTNTVQGEHSAVLEFILKETQTEEQKDNDDDSVEAVFSRLLLNARKDKCYSPLHSFLQDSQLQSFQEDNCDRSQDQTLPNSGFDFQHLKVLCDIPFSSFYGVDFDNPKLPVQSSSQIGSFYGLDTESLAAENAALDDFYAKRKCGKDAFESDQSRGSHHSEERDLDLLFPNSTSEEDDDIMTIKFLYTYKLCDGPLPYLVDQPEPTLGPQHPLLVYINSMFQKSECISESRLTEKVLKLQTKYKKLAAEKGKSPEDQEFSTPHELKFFRLSRTTWEQNEEPDVHPKA